MKPKENLNKPAQVGDVYCVRDGGKNEPWCALQVVEIGKDYFVTVELDWYSEKLLTIAQLQDIKLLQMYRSGLNGEIAVHLSSCEDELIAPNNYVLIGKTKPPTLSIKKRGYTTSLEYKGVKTKSEGLLTNWPSPWFLIRFESEWFLLPENERIKFNESYKKNIKLKIQGLTDEDCNSRDSSIEVKENGIKDWHLLDELGCLTRITISGKQDGLTNYLATRKLIEDLSWKNCSNNLIDITKTAVSELEIEFDSRLTKTDIYLAPHNKELQINQKNVAGLQIHHTTAGAGLELKIWGLKKNPLPDFKLPKLSILFLGGGCHSIDFKLIADFYPNLDSFSIYGDLAVAKNISHLGRLKQLRYLSLNEVFGYQASDFPSRAELSNLENLIVRLYPKEATERMTQEFSEIDKFDIEQGKSADWVSDNIDNPFRMWEGRHFSTKELKTAHNAYKAANKSIRALKGKRDDKAALEILKAFVVAMNALGKNIYTLERDEVSDIFDDLLTALGIEPSNKKYQDYFDDWRDF